MAIKASLEVSDTLSARAEQSLFGFRSRHPYYIAAPHYSESSAGVRTLYILCHALNAIGEEAYVVVDAEPDLLEPAEVAGLRTPRLNITLAERHHQFGRTPIAIFPETFTPRYSDAVTAIYLLNYVGHLGGPNSFKDADFIFAYSKNIARRSDNCEFVLHIPVVDADFWTPDEHLERTRPAIYAGKYWDHHGGEFPPVEGDPIVITRLREDSPSKFDMREIFRSATHLYVYENTAAALEAALCGCPVVYKKNQFFDEIISEQELGLRGFTESDDPLSLSVASEELAYFRKDYENTKAQFGKALLKFVEKTQDLADQRVYDRPYRVPGSEKACQS
jgi:hypothetical protein